MGNDNSLMEPSGAESPKGLMDFLIDIDTCASATESAVGEFLVAPDRPHLSQINETLTAQAWCIRDTLRFVVTQKDLQTSEKAQLIADILVQDDTRRVSFLNNVCQPAKGSEFRVGYPEVTEIAEDLGTVLDLSEDFDELISDLMSNHADFMRRDLSSFMDEPMTQEQIQQYSKSQERRQRVIRFAETVGASALGYGIVQVVTELVKHH